MSDTTATPTTKTNTASGKATPAAAKGDPAPVAPPPAPPPFPASLLAHPAYRQAHDTLTRVELEARRLETALADTQARWEAVKTNRDARAEAILAGREPERIDVIEKEHAELRSQLADTRAAVEIAKRGLMAARQQARADLARPLLGHQREVVRRVVFAMLETARVWDAMHSWHQDLQDADLMAGDLVDVLPRQAPWGRMDDPHSMLNLWLGELLDRGFLDPVKDAAALAGTHPQVASPPAPPAPPRPPKKVNEAELRGLRRMGVAIPRG